MYGVYAWIAGATAAQLQQDLVALICGGAVADLSAGANKAGCSVSGAASGWTALDAGYGVIKRDGQAGGPGMVARLSVSATPRIQLQAVDAWATATHTAGSATTAFDVSLTTTAAGSVNLMASDAGLLIAAADWSYWGALAEVKRDGPALAGDALAPGAFTINNSGYVYMPRLKAPTATGDLTAVSCSLSSAYGSLSGGAARDRTEKLYFPMSPATVAYSSVPVGEVAGLLTIGGYGQSGDYVQDAGGVTYQLVKAAALGIGIPKV